MELPNIHMHGNAVMSNSILMSPQGCETSINWISWIENSWVREIRPTNSIEALLWEILVLLYSKKKLNDPSSLKNQLSREENLKFIIKQQ